MDKKKRTSSVIPKIEKKRIRHKKGLSAVMASESATPSKKYIDKMIKKYSHQFRSETRSRERKFVSPNRDDYPKTYFIEKNRAVTPFYPEVKEEKTKDFFKVLNLRHSISKETKFKVLADKKERQLYNLSEKFRKFDLRMRKIEAIQLKKAWLIYYILAGVGLVSTTSIKNRKKLHERSSKLMKWFRAFCRSLGRMRLRLKEIRIEKSKRMLKLRCIPLVYSWINRQRSMYTNMVVDTLENCLTFSMLISLRYKWRAKINYLHDMMCKLIRDRRTFYGALMKQWITIETIFQQSKAAKKVKMYRKSIMRDSSTPSDVKQLYLRKELKRAVKEHCQTVNNYKYEVMIRKTACYQELVDSGWLDEEGNIILPEKVPDFYAKAVFSHDLIVALVKKAEKEKSEWGFLLKQEEDAIQRTK